MLVKRAAFVKLVPMTFDELMDEPEWWVNFILSYETIVNEHQIKKIKKDARKRNRHKSNR